MIYLLKVIALSLFILLNGDCCAAQGIIAPHNIVTLDKETLRDLDLIGCEKKTLSSMIDRTITECGRQELHGHLLRPTCDVSVLRERQTNIQFFVMHFEHTRTLREQLFELKEYESALKQENKEKLAQQALDRVYFTVPEWEHYNTNPYALDLAYGMHIISLCGPFVEHVLMHIGIDLLAGGGHADHDDHHDHKHEHHHHHGCSHHHHAPAIGNNQWVYYGLQGLHWGLHLPGLYDMACDIRERALMIKYLQHQVIQITRYVEGARGLYEAMVDYPSADFEQVDFQPYNMLAYFFDEQPACSDEMKRLFELLNSSTFQGEPSYFSHTGNVLAAYKCYANVQKEFQLLVHAVGQLDMYLALASLMHKQKPREWWAFVQFTEKSDAPHLALQKVRNLFVTEPTASNFSSDDAQHRLVMGDNGVGKSTYLLSIGHALFMAQTFGIVPAVSCEMTPFNQILTFRIVQDDFSAGISRFYAECARVEKIVHSTQCHTGFSCAILDEPFVHTNASKGLQHLKQSLASLGSAKNTLSIVATHYQDVEPSWSVEHLS